MISACQSQQKFVSSGLRYCQYFSMFPRPGLSESLIWTLEAAFYLKCLQQIPWRHLVSKHTTSPCSSRPLTCCLLQCVGGQCQGHNALHNLDHLDRLFLRHLLHADDAKRWHNAQQADCLLTIFSAVRDRLKESTLSAHQLLCQLYAAQRCVRPSH